MNGAEARKKVPNKNAKKPYSCFLNVVSNLLCIMLLAFKEGKSKVKNNKYFSLN